MTLKKLYILAIAMMVAVLLMPLGAQEQQRKVTPVKPSTNKVLTPPKGTDEKTIERYLTGDTTSLRAQEIKDSLARIYPHYPALTEMWLGVNFADGLLKVFGQKYASFDFHATFNMWNRLQPVVVAGLGVAKDTPDDMNFTYRGKLSPYFKLGANYNFLYKKEPQYQLYAGVRLGFSTFKYDITDATIQNPYWGEANDNFELKGNSGNALWGEMLVGLKVGIASNWALGWEAKFHGMFKEKKSDHGMPWFIPGFGTRGGKWAFGLSLYYTIPMNRDRWPAKDEEKKKLR